MVVEDTLPYVVPFEQPALEPVAIEEQARHG
jgi:hypothetical protein